MVLMRQQVGANDTSSGSMTGLFVVVSAFAAIGIAVVLGGVLLCNGVKIKCWVHSAGSFVVVVMGLDRRRIG